MSGAPSTEWFVQGYDGKSYGPYSAEQIQQFLKAGQVKPDQPMTAAHLEGKWSTVGSVLAELEAVRQFQPPPRPEAILSHPEHLENAAQSLEPDPVLSLFDALQAARDRKAVTPQVFASSITPEQPWYLRIPQRAWLAGALTLAFTGLSYALLESLKKGSEVTEVASKSERAAPAPMTRSAENRIPATTPVQTPPQLPAAVPKPVTLPLRPTANVTASKPAVSNGGSSIRPDIRFPSARTAPPPSMVRNLERERDQEANDRDRDLRDQDRREQELRERELEREREQANYERDREAELAKDRSGDRDRDRDRDRPSSDENGMDRDPRDAGSPIRPAPGGEATPGNGQGYDQRQ